MSDRDLTQARRASLRVLYAVDVSGLPPLQVLENLRGTLADEGEQPDPHWEQVVLRVTDLLANLESIDAEIRRLSPRWRIERMAVVDRNLLRLGIHEILQRSTRALLTINAAVELAKEFGAASTPAFINGLLDQLCQDHEIPIKS